MDAERPHNNCRGWSVANPQIARTDRFDGIGCLRGIRDDKSTISEGLQGVACVLFRDSTDLDYDGDGDRRRGVHRDCRE